MGDNAMLVSPVSAARGSARMAVNVGAACIVVGLLLGLSAHTTPRNAVYVFSVHLSEPSVSEHLEHALDVQGGVIEKLEQRALSARNHARRQALTRHLAHKYKLSEPQVRRYVNLAFAHARPSEGVTPELLLAMMEKESSLREHVTNSYGAMGLMQVVPRFHPEKIRPGESLLVPEVNVRVGARILREYLSWSNGDLDKALKRYSGNARQYGQTVKDLADKLLIASSPAPYAQGLALR